MKHGKKISMIAAAVSLACSMPALAAQQQQAEDTSAGDYASQHGGSHQSQAEANQYGQKQMHEDMQQKSAGDYASQHGGDRQSQAEGDQYGQQQMHEDMQQKSAGDLPRESRAGNNQYGQEQRRDEAQQKSMGDESRNMRAGQQGSLVEESVVTQNNIDKFTQAVNKAGLTSALKSGESFTVFAPTDEAFEALDEDKASELMDEENVEELRELLRSHIVAGKVDAERARGLSEAKVLTGKTVPLSTQNGQLQVGDATVVNSNIESDNLTIHTINKVLDADASAGQDRDEKPENDGNPND